MSAGVPPDHPDWHVLYQDPLQAWLQREPPLLWITPVTEWVEGCKLAGPPPNARPISEDRFLDNVPGTNIVAEFLLVEYEYLIIVKEFR